MSIGTMDKESMGVFLKLNSMANLFFYIQEKSMKQYLKNQ